MTPRRPAMAADERGTTSALQPVPAQPRGRVSRVVEEAVTIGEILSVGVLTLVRSTLVTTIAGVRDVGGEVGAAATAAVRGAIRAAAEVGGDLASVARQAIRGTIQATEEVGGDLGVAARAAARGAVKTASEVGGDIGRVAASAVEGAIEAARDLGVDVTKIARSASEGAVDAADRIGSAASRTVRGAVGQIATGAKAVAGAVRGKRVLVGSGAAAPRATKPRPRRTPRARPAVARRPRRSAR